MSVTCDVRLECKDAPDERLKSMLVGLDLWSLLLLPCLSAWRSVDIEPNASGATLGDV